MRVKMIQDLGNNMEAQTEKIQEMFYKDLEELQQTKMNNTITEMKNILDGINNRITEAEEQISDLEDRMVEITVEEQNKEKRMKRIEDNLRDPGTTLNATTFKLSGSPEEEEKKKGSKKIFQEIIVENYPNMGKEIVNQTQ